MSTNIKQYDIWIANLDKRMGTEPGKQRPVVVVQSNLLNDVRHPSTLICPLTTHLSQNPSILRVRILGEAQTGLVEDSEAVVDQVRAIDNRRLIKRLGKLQEKEQHKLCENLQLLVGR